MYVPEKRQIFLDTETTGLSPKNGHRIVEIGCLEVVNRRLTGNFFHRYINPEREVDPEAVQVHGLTYERLKTEPLFADLLQEFISFVDGAEILIHNAPFDVGFLDAELVSLSRSVFSEYVFSVVDTLSLARKMHPGRRNSLDALCERYSIPRQHRKLHGALLDAELLARVYLAMTRGQDRLDLKERRRDIEDEEGWPPESLLVRYASEEELMQHDALILDMAREAPPLWTQEWELGVDLSAQ